MKQAALAVGEKILRKKEVASILACSARSIDRLASSGRLDRIRYLGAVRFRLSQVQAIIGGGAA